MANSYTTGNHAKQIRQSVVSDVISYMKICEIPAYFINPRLVQLALESSYKAQPVFWRALDRATVLRALEIHAPGFERSLSFVEENAYEILINRIDFMLDVRFRDELHAEILLSAPKSKQQLVLKEPFKYLVHQLYARGEVDLAQVLMAERETAPGAALELVEAQRAAREGRPFMTELMQDAMVARDAFIFDRPFDRADSEDDQ
ncbi:hypothetical protein HDG40_000780 [Paraburkholderia sp. JPY158]|uniref:Uncharacterized protein n=1 Tax=Paraburkholderia atlantica TaxID=2654982 RepID=A0A7W8Q3M4_PARAM|nr:hypothetical protein [Paraburkholderia atlantica]MBB5422639.1 hypothetical protein [Paraburkholderia atlantica]